jgi:hypothetical protein
MRKSFLIVLLAGLLAPIANAQPPQPADQLAQPPQSYAPYESYGGEGGMMGGGYGGGEEYGRGGYEGGYGSGGYGGRGGYESPANPRAMRQIVDQWKAATDASERDKLEQSLRNRLKTEFNARMNSHVAEIKELEEKVRQLRARLNLRREKQDEIVDHRLQQLLRDAEGLGWGADEMSRRGAYSDFLSPTAQNAPANPLTTQAVPSALEPAVADDEIEPSSESAPATAPLRTP